MKDNKMLIIDGTSLLVDAYYNSLTEQVHNAESEEDRALALENLEKDSKGRYIGAVRGFFSVLLNGVDNIKPTHITVVWGTSRSTNIRKEIYDGYKDDNRDMDIPLREQFKTTQALLAPLVKQFTSNKYEAIDLVGTIADKMKDKAEIYIMARNNNYLQLADIGTVFLKTSRAALMLEQYNIDSSNVIDGFFPYTNRLVREVKSLAPIEMLDYFSLVGVSSTGVPGVTGIGPTKALTLIKKYSNIENIYGVLERDNPIEIRDLLALKRGVPGVLDNLRREKDKAFISKRLLTIVKDVYVNEEEIENSKNILNLENVFLALRKVDLVDFSCKDALGRENGINDFTTLINNSVDFVITGKVSPNGLDVLSANIEGIKREYEDAYDDLDDYSYTDTEGDCFSMDFGISGFNSSYDEDFEECYDGRYEYNEDYIEKHVDAREGYREKHIDVSEESEVRPIYIPQEGNNTIELVETIVIKKYICHECSKTFTVFGETKPKFCINCGAKQYDNTKPNIDVLENTGCNMRDLVITDRENLNLLSEL